MSHYYGEQPLQTQFAAADLQVTPLRYGNGPGEYETQYRPDVNTYDHDMKTPYEYGYTKPAELPRDGHPNFKPGPLRWPLLCALIATLIGLIAVTGWASHALPVENNTKPLPTTALKPAATTSSAVPFMVRVQDSHSYAQNGTVILTTTDSTSTSPTGVKTETLPQSNYGKDGSVTVTIGTVAPGNYGQDGSVTVPMATTNPSNYGKDGSVTIPVTAPYSNYAGLGETTLNGVVSTTVVEITSNGLVTSVTQTTILNGVATTISPTYITAQVATLTNSLGLPTATLTSTPPAVSTPTVLTLTDSNGVPTATVSTSALAAPITTVLTDSKGVPTATVTQYAAVPTIPLVHTQVYCISKGDYFVGFFLPPVVCVLLTIPIRMIDLSAKQFQPFHELTHPLGAGARESLVLNTNGIHGIIIGIRSLFAGHGLVFMTTLLTLCSVLLVPLSTEAIGLKMHGVCGQTDFNGCAMTLAVFLVPARATMALLGFMVVVVAFLLFFLARWRSGVAANPRSIAGIATLSTNSDVRALFSALPTGRDGRITRQQLAAALDGRTFKLDYFFNMHGEPEYGIVIDNEAGRGLQGSNKQPDLFTANMESGGTSKQKKVEHHLPFMMLTYTWRVAFLLLLTGLLAVIIYYNNTGGDTPFEQFMDTQGFGVRFLFTLIGIAITFFWSSFFSSVATISPYHLLSRSPQFARNSILLSPSLHAATGIWSAVRRRHVFLVVVAFTAILSEFMPILLNNVPMRVTQTWVTHLVCTWLSVSILCVMWLVLLASFFVKWPHMPVDPSTVAGSMYYVCDSWMLYSFQGLSTLTQWDRDWKINKMRFRYEYGDIQGVSGLRRHGVDSEGTRVRSKGLA